MKRRLGKDDHARETHMSKPIHENPSFAVSAAPNELVSPLSLRSRTLAAREKRIGVAHREW